MFFEKLKKKFAVMQYHTQLSNARVQVGAAPVVTQERPLML